MYEALGDGLDGEALDSFELLRAVDLLQRIV
jgi:hypothetical protein